MKFQSELGVDDVIKKLEHTTMLWSNINDTDMGKAFSKISSNNRFYLSIKMERNTAGKGSIDNWVFWGKIIPEDYGSLITGYFFWRLKDYIFALAFFFAVATFVCITTLFHGISYPDTYFSVIFNYYITFILTVLFYLVSKAILSWSYLDACSDKVVEFIIDNLLD